MAQFAGGGGGGSRRAPAVTAPKNSPKPKIGAFSSGLIKAVPKSAPAAPRSSGRSSYSSGGYSGGGGGGGGGGGIVGSSSSGRISPSAPKPPSLADFLNTDSAYTSQMSALQKARADYMAQQGQTKTNYLTGYTGDLSKLKDNRTNALGDLENDFASRGLLQSGLYADNMSDLTKDFDTKQSDLEKAKAQFLAQLASDLTNFSSEQDITRTKAKQDAVARRSSSYGI